MSSIDVLGYTPGLLNFLMHLPCMDRALDFFEDLIIYTVKDLLNNNEKDLKALGVALKIPEKSFPKFRKDKALERFNSTGIEAELGRTA